MKIAIGADHGGYKRKLDLLKFLKSLGHSVKDLGTISDESVDYPDFAREVAREVKSGRAKRGVLVCGTGIGMCIAANKVKGIRAAPVWSEETAKLAAEHNGAIRVELSPEVPPSPEIVTALLRRLLDEGIAVERVAPVASSLEDHFLNVTTRLEDRS